MIECKTSLGGLEQLIQRLETYKKEELERTIAITIESKIIADANAGDDIDGNRFTPYTPKYKKWRQKKSLQTEIVDLRVKGDLLNSIVVTKNGVITTVSVKEDMKAIAEGNMRYRKWFGISKETKEEIKNYVKTFVGSVIHGK